MRRVGWVVAALAALAIGSGQAPKSARAPSPDNVYVTADGTRCPAEGDNPRQALIDLDLQKNRATAPAADDLDRDVTLAAILAPGTDIGRFDPTRGAVVVAVVVRVKQGSKETCNCHAANDEDQDTHIELALSADATRTQRVVVEVTPRLRKQMRESGVDWSTATLQGQGSADGIVGKWVRVTGWLFFDEIHLNISENTNPGGRNNVRATCWEIHPITGLEVLAEPPPATRQLHPEILTQMQSVHAKSVAQSPALREEIARRNDALLKKYGDEEVREAREEAQEPPKPEEIRKAKSLPK